MSIVMGEQGRNLDYISAWFRKSAEMMQNSYTQTAFVSTNSVTQGEQVAGIWKPIYNQFHIHIDFAYRTFKWSNEGRGKAQVHCVIIGFSSKKCDKIPQLFLDAKHSVETDVINFYLTNAPVTFIENRLQPICDAPTMNKGSIPVDGGHLIIDSDEYDDFIESEPDARKYIRLFLGSKEFINNEKRYCLWLKDCVPAELLRMPNVKNRVAKVRDFRASSKKEATRKFADMPSVFMEMRQPESSFIAVPEVSSESRKYIPIGFLTPDIIVSNKIFVIPNADLYHFGILTSSVHMAWMRAVCGRLKSDYSYSNKIVYNNFPWPDLSGMWGVGCGKKKVSETTEEYQKRVRAKISLCSEEILRIREKYPNSSLADLYSPLGMPPELLKAHKALDKAVMELYGYSPDMSEPEIVADLMVRYQKLVDAENSKNAAETAASPGSKSKRSRKKKTDD